MSKPAATLTSSLLALKGRASTAGFTPPPEPSVMPAALSAAGAVEPLLATRLPRPLAPRRDSKSAPKAAKSAKESSPAGAPSCGGGNRGAGAATVRLSYRMAPSEHRRFALLAAHLGKSKQQLLDEALAAYMARHGSEVAGGACACLGGAALRNGRPNPTAAEPRAGDSGASGPIAIAAAGEAE